MFLPQMAGKLAGMFPQGAGGMPRLPPTSGIGRLIGAGMPPQGMAPSPVAGAGMAGKLAGLAGTLPMQPPPPPPPAPGGAAQGAGVGLIGRLAGKLPGMMGASEPPADQMGGPPDAGAGDQITRLLAALKGLKRGGIGSLTPPPAATPTPRTFPRIMGLMRGR